MVLYEQVKEKIAALIHERGIQAHEPVPSEGELAALFGVSKMTAKLALNALADEGVVYRLRRRGTFLSDSAEGSQAGASAASPKPETPRLIGLVVPEIDNYISEVITHTEHALRKQGLGMLLVVNGSAEQEEEALRDLADRKKVEGIILLSVDRKHCGPQLLKLSLARFPLVIIDRMFREINMTSVYHDHYQGTYDLTEALIEGGHREIGFVSEPIVGIMSREERYQGYIQAMLDRHIPVQAPYIALECRLADKKTIGGQTVADLADYLKANGELTAVICSNDYVAAHLLYAALRLGIRVPEQLSLVGYTDMQVTGFLPVPVTSVRKPARPLAETAVELLLERIEHPETPERTVKLKTEMIERASTRFRQP